VLTLPYQTLFTAHDYLVLLPIIDRDQTAEKFFGANEWVGQYATHPQPLRASRYRIVKLNRTLLTIAKIGEWLLGGRLGDWVERKAKQYQQKRIFANPITAHPDGRIAVTDDELAFHPHSVETKILTQYQERLRAIQ
jgi:hypothetical protein